MPFAGLCALCARSGVLHGRARLREQWGLVRGSWERQTPSPRPPKGRARGKARLPPTDRSPWLPEQGPGTGQRRLNSAGSVSGRAINKSVGGNGGMSQRREGEKVIFGGTHYPSPACHRAPEPSEDSRQRLSSSCSSSPIASCREDDGGRPCRWEPRPQLGGCSPLPIPGTPRSMQLEHGWIHPAPRDPERVGWGIARAPGPARSSRCSPQPWASFVFLGTSHIHTPAAPRTPGQGAPQQKRPSLPPSIAAATGHGARHGNA